MGFWPASTEADDVISTALAPLQAVTPNTWYRDTLALGRISIEGDSGDPVFDYHETSADGVVE